MSVLLVNVHLCCKCACFQPNIQVKMHRRRKADRWPPRNITAARKFNNIERSFFKSFTGGREVLSGTCKFHSDKDDILGKTSSSKTRLSHMWWDFKWKLDPRDWSAPLGYGLLFRSTRGHKTISSLPTTYWKISTESLLFYLL